MNYNFILKSLPRTGVFLPSTRGIKKCIYSTKIFSNVKLNLYINHLINNNTFTTYIKYIRKKIYIFIFCC